MKNIKELRDFIATESLTKEDAEEFCEMLNRWFGFERGEQDERHKMF